MKKVSMALLLSSACLFANAQQTVKGTVKDASGEPMIGVSVKVKGTSIGGVTDLNGHFTIQNVPSSAKLQASYIGYLTKTVSVGSQSNLNIVLEEDNAALDEVVVIGYQTVKRRDLTGSVASVNNKQLTAVPVSDVSQALQGKLPGVNIVAQDGRPDASISIRVRGGGSISQSNEPLILIDGVAGTLSDIPADQVESIDVLKDASSTAIYGARGANGVILVTTKRAKEGRAVVTYNGYAKWNTPTKYLDALNPYDYISYIWANAAAQDNPDYTEPIETLFGLNNGGLEKWRGVKAYDVQKDVYNSSFSHNHDLSVTGGTDKTRYLLSVNYNDEEGMKVNSYRRRANISGKIDQKINKDLDFGLDFRYVDVETMSGEGVTNGQGSTLSSAFRFRPVSIADIERLGDAEGFYQGAIAQYGKQWLWDMYDPYQKTMDYEPLQNRQFLRGTASLNWRIIPNLTYHTDFTLRRGWQQNKTWSGPVYNSYLDDKTGEALYAGAATLYKGDSWGLRWTNTLNYDWEINKDHHLNVLAGHELSNSGGNSMTIQADYFPANFTKENAFAMINQYDKSKSTIVNPPTIIGEELLQTMEKAGSDESLIRDIYLSDGRGGFAPQGWTVPYASQYQKIIDNIAGIATNKPDGTIGASFLKGGVYGLNTKATGLVGVIFQTDNHGSFNSVSLCNKNVLYLGAIADADREKLDGMGNVYGALGDLESQLRCDALAVSPSEGSAAMTWFLDQAIVLLDKETITDTHIYPETIRNKGDNADPIAHAMNQFWNGTKYDMPAYKMCFPVIICQRVIK